MQQHSGGDHLKKNIFQVMDSNSPFSDAYRKKHILK